VLIKFKLLEWQQVAYPTLLEWCRATPYLQRSMSTSDSAADGWLRELLNELERSGALRQEADVILNT